MSDLASLMRKYLALTRKYEQLVTHTARDRSDRSWVFRLGAWALRGTSAAMAVVEDGEVVLHNPNWLRLGRLRDWRSLEGKPRRYAGLADLTLGEAGRLSRRRQPASSSRFVSSDDEQVVKVRLEQVSDGRT